MCLGKGGGDDGMLHVKIVDIHFTLYMKRHLHTSLLCKYPFKEVKFSYAVTVPSNVFGKRLTNPCTFGHIFVT